MPPRGPAGRRGLPHALRSSCFSFVATPLPPSRFVRRPPAPHPRTPLFCPPVVVAPPSPSLPLPPASFGMPGFCFWQNRQGPARWPEPRLGSSWDGGAEAPVGLPRQVSAGGLRPRRVGSECLAGGGQAAWHGGLARTWTEWPWTAMVRRLCPLCDPTPASVPCCPGCLTEQSDRAWPGLLGLGTMADTPGAGWSQGGHGVGEPLNPAPL